MCYKNYFSCTEKKREKKHYISAQFLERLTDQQCISYCTEVGQLINKPYVDGIKNNVVVPVTSHKRSLFLQFYSETLAWSLSLRELINEFHLSFEVRKKNN